MAFGLCNAPELFQKTMEMVLSGCKGVVVFMDDIIVFGESLEEHDQNLRKVLEVLENYGICLKPPKCRFRQAEVQFLGHKFSRLGATPTEDKIAAVMNAREPQNSAEVRSFLGMVNYVGPFIKNLATLTSPLNKISNEKSKFCWTETEANAFQKIKEKITKIDFLSPFDHRRRTRLVVDASPIGLGAVLLQYVEGMPHVIGYASKALTTTQQKYHQTEKEALAIVWGVEKFSNYLYGINFEIESDHKALEFLFKAGSKPCLRVERWVLRLQAYKFTVIYKKGAENIADSLSRLIDTNLDQEPFKEDSEAYINALTESIAVDFAEIEEATQKDPELLELYECLKTGNWCFASENLKKFLPFRNELGYVGKMIVREDRIIIPEYLRTRILELGHEGHPGQTVMTKRLRSKLWWPRMDTDIINHVKNCSQCLIVSRGDPPEPVIRSEMPKGPWKFVAIDFLGPLPNGQYILVAICYFSRYKEVKFMSRITAKATIIELEEIFVRLGYPEKIRLDNGKQFISTEFKTYCDVKNIQHDPTTPYSPNENGEVERQNRSLLKRLRIAYNEGLDLKEELQRYLMMYYTTPHTITNKTPTQLMYGYTIRSKLPSLPDLNMYKSNESAVELDKIRKFAGKTYIDGKRRAKFSEIEEGDRVLVKNLTPENKLSARFDKEPGIVTRKTGSRCTVKMTNSDKVYERKSCHLKRTPDQPPPTTISLSQPGIPTAPLDKQQKDSEPAEQHASDPQDNDSSTHRPSRTHRAPAKYQDYVMRCSQEEGEM